MTENLTLFQNHITGSDIMESDPLRFGIRQPRMCARFGTGRSQAARAV